jgi:hypothetical protein
MRVVSSLAAVALGIVACGGDKEHPPILENYGQPPGFSWDTDASADATTDSASGMSACLPKFAGVARTEPIRGTVQELDDPTFAIAPEPLVRFARATPLGAGSVSVEAEKPSCGLASTTTQADGTYVLEGAASGAVFLRLVPVGRPDLMTTIVSAPADSGITVPVVSRRAVRDLLSMVAPGSEPNPQKAQILMSFIAIGDILGSLPGGTITASVGKIAYDGSEATGPLGLAVAANADAPDYPGGRTEVVGKYPERDDQREPSGSVIAKDAVTLLFVGFK